MPHRFGLRRSVASGLLLLQLSLLTISGFHYHDDAALAGGKTPSTLRTAPSSALPTPSDWVLCPVCQIMRLGAARPALRSADPQAVTYSFSACSRVPVYCFSLRPAAIYGRAPPLS
jgi:hypothetical protein